MKTFFRTIKHSFGNSDLYSKVKNESAWKGVGFLAKFGLFLGIIFGIIGIVVLLIVLPLLQKRVVPYVSGLYPEGLVLTLTNGELTTNSEGPVLVPVPEKLKEDAPEADAHNKSTLVAIAPDEAADAAVLEKYDAFVVLTKTAAVMGDVDDQIRVQTYKDMSGTMTKEKFSQLVSGGTKIFKTIALIAAIPAGILFAFGIAFIHLVWLFIVAILIWLVFKLRHLPHTYKQSYRMGVYAIVPLMLIEIVATPLDISGKILSILVIVGAVWIASRDWNHHQPETNIAVQPPEVGSGN